MTLATTPDTKLDMRLDETRDKTPAFDARSGRSMSVR